MVGLLKYQMELFLLALSFFSRIPIPEQVPYSKERMNSSGRYFSLVGLLLGLICASGYYLFSALFSNVVAIFIMMVSSLFLTGAFHEDGIADMADGIGGGMTVERRLLIMKDSRIGTYGASALIMVLLGKYVLLVDLSTQIPLFWLIIFVYGWSRAVAAAFIYCTPYVSDTATSKSKPLASQQSTSELIILMLIGLLPSVNFALPFVLSVLVLSAVFFFSFRMWLLKRLGGFTGDCLGGAQQIMELLVYLLAVFFFQHHYRIIG
jgi:adenosylcobinamide-GDP ribazoletransferase